MQLLHLPVVCMVYVDFAQGVQLLQSYSLCLCCHFIIRFTLQFKFPSKWSTLIPPSEIKWMENAVGQQTTLWYNPPQPPLLPSSHKPKVEFRYRLCIRPIKIFSLYREKS